MSSDKQGKGHELDESRVERATSRSDENGVSGVTKETREKLRDINHNKGA